MRVRIADPGLDAGRVAEIYRPFVEDTTISFEENSPTPAAMGERMRDVLDWTPWLVAVDDDDQVVGYAYASRHRERAGYRWSVDLTVYVDSGLRRQGIGRMLYAELLPILHRQRFRVSAHRVDSRLCSKIALEKTSRFSRKI
jgi:phosphinothricin acetyltransferase